MANLHSEVDLRLERRLKRKSLTNRSYKKELRQQASKKRQCLSVGLKDLDYKTFLENLKEYKNSYALVVYNDNGEAEELMYETLNSRNRKSSVAMNEKKRVPEDSSGSLANSRRLRSDFVRNCSVGETEVLRCETLYSRDRKSSDVGSDKKTVPEDSGGSLVNSRRLRSGLVRNCSVWEAEELRYETVNSQDRKFSATRNEKKQVPEDSSGSLVNSRKLRSGLGRKCSVGEAEELGYETFNSRGRKSSAMRDEKKWVAEDSDRSVAKSRRLRSGSVRNCSVGRKTDTRSGFVEWDYDRQIIEHYVDHEEKEYGEFLHGKRSRKSVPTGRSSLCDVSFSESCDGSESESGETGKDYREYLECYAMEEEDEDVMSEQGSDSDSDLVVLDVSSSEADFIDLELEDNPREYLNPRSSEFKKELLAVLKKPYDSKKHQELQDLVRVRHPVSESKDLRGGTKMYPSAHKLADSYLAIYPDFAEVFNRAKEDKLSLMLLRGFFFYIKKMGDRYKFKPWKYPELFKVMRTK